MRWSFDISRRKERQKSFYLKFIPKMSEESLEKLNVIDLLNTFWLFCWLFMCTNRDSIFDRKEKFSQLFHSLRHCAEINWILFYSPVSRTLMLLWKRKKENWFSFVFILEIQLNILLEAGPNWLREEGGRRFTVHPLDVLHNLILL